MRTPNQILKDEGVDTAKLANVNPNLYSSVIRAMGEFAEQYHKWKANSLKTSNKVRKRICACERPNSDILDSDFKEVCSNCGGYANC